MKEESERIGRMNILVATPGRLLQHMDQSPTFNADTLQILGFVFSHIRDDCILASLSNSAICRFIRTEQSLTRPIEFLIWVSPVN
jgi:hypothetical protein